MKYHKCAEVEKEGIIIELHDDGSAYHDWCVDNCGMPINYCPICGLQLSFREKPKKDGIIRENEVLKNKMYKVFDQDEHYVYLEDIDDNQICLTYKEYEEFFDHEC